MIIPMKRELISFIVLVMLIPMLAQACPMCASLDDPLGNGINLSIIFLMTMPFAVFGSVGGWLFYTYRRPSGFRLFRWRDLLIRLKSYLIRKGERN